MCAHRERPYAGSPRRHSLVESERAQDGCIILPLYPQMSDGEQERVVDALAAACAAQRPFGWARRGLLAGAGQA